MDDLENKIWWSYLEEGQKELLKEALVLLKREEAVSDNFHDYAFVVFPAAKAYEGFLKKLFLDLGLITQEQYTSDHFRIGKALNPNLPEHYRKEGWVVDSLAAKCGGEDLPRLLWDVWKKSRNLIHS